jgi:hypothetical protein
MDYMKFLAVAAVMSVAMASGVQAQDGESCDATAATEDLADDCIPVVPAGTEPLAATNLGIIIPVAATLLLGGLAAAGGGGGSTPDTQ